MAIFALDLSKTEDYIVKSDRGSESPTVFKLGTLDSRVMGLIQDQATTVKVDPSRDLDEEVETTINNGKVQFLKVQFGVKGFENLIDQTGSCIEYKTDKYILGNKTYNVLSADIVNRLPRSVIAELADRIVDLNELGEEDLKN